MPAIHLLIKGKVQGVYFRASAKEKAKTLGVTGWVKNNRDGAVEMLAVATEHALEQLVCWCHLGPSAAVVQEVIITNVDEAIFNSFLIKND